MPGRKEISSVTVLTPTVSSSQRGTCRCVRWKTEAELVVEHLSSLCIWKPEITAPCSIFTAHFEPICSTWRTHSSCEQLYYEFAGLWRNPCVCVSPTAVSHYHKALLEALFVVWKCETHVFLQSPQVFCFLSQVTIVASSSEILGLCALCFTPRHFSSFILLPLSWPNMSGSCKSTAAMPKIWGFWQPHCSLWRSTLSVSVIFRTLWPHKDTFQTTDESKQHEKDKSRILCYSLF